MLIYLLKIIYTSLTYFLVFFLYFLLLLNKKLLLFKNLIRVKVKYCLSIRFHLFYFIIIIDFLKIEIKYLLRNL